MTSAEAFRRSQQAEKSQRRESSEARTFVLKESQCHGVGLVFTVALIVGCSAPFGHFMVTNHETDGQGTVTPPLVTNAVNVKFIVIFADATAP